MLDHEDYEPDIDKMMDDDLESSDYSEDELYDDEPNPLEKEFDF